MAKLVLPGPASSAALVGVWCAPTEAFMQTGCRMCDHFGADGTLRSAITCEGGLVLAAHGTYEADGETITVVELIACPGAEHVPWPPAGSVHEYVVMGGELVIEHGKPRVRAISFPTTGCE